MRAISDTDTFATKYGSARCINEAITHNKEKREVCISVCNYAQEDCEVSFELRSFGSLRATEYLEMTSSDLFAVNGFDAPENVVPHERELPSVKDDHMTLRLPAMSWSFVKLCY